MLAVVVAVVLSTATRYGLVHLLVRSAEADNRVSARSGVRFGSDALGLWRWVQLACAGALAIGLVSIIIGNSHLLSAEGAFFVAVVGQQVTFAATELLVAGRPVEIAKPLARVAALAALMALAAGFAATSNITFLAQKPPAPPMFSDQTNLLFAIPALLVGVAGIAGWRPRLSRA